MSLKGDPANHPNISFYKSICLLGSLDTEIKTPGMDWSVLLGKGQGLGLDVWSRGGQGGEGAGWSSLAKIIPIGMANFSFPV